MDIDMSILRMLEREKEISFEVLVEAIEQAQHQHTDIAERLVETALAHCKDHGYLKIRLDTRFDPNAVIDLFDRFGFQHTRTKSLENKEMLEFYLDLYRQSKSGVDEANDIAG